LICNWEKVQKRNLATACIFLQVLKSYFMKDKAHNPLQTALVAYGLSGRAFHAPFIVANPHFSLRKVVERHGNESALKYPQVKVCRALDEVLEDEAIELVVITTPNRFHYPMAKQALAAGKHVVLEKPFAVTSDEARELIIFAEKQQKMLTVYQNRRWDGDFLTLQSLLDQEALGTLVSYESHFNRFRPQIKNSWKEIEGEAGGGILYDLGPHLIDQALCLFGSPETVYADIRQQRPSAKTPDAFDLMLDYGNLKVNLRASALVRAPVPRFLLHGTAGSFVKYGMDPQEAELRAGNSPDTEGWGMEREEYWGSLHASRNGLTFKGKVETLPGNYAAFYKNIYAHLRHQEALAVNPHEVLKGMEIIELAHKSAAEGRKLTYHSQTAL
jgi:scyllo-inositol 2-dehydrogenase (NADP+)